MTADRPLPRATKPLAAALFVAGLGVFVQYLVGVPGFPTIPPGPIILGTATVLVLILTPRYRWMLIVGLVTALFMTGGVLLEGSVWGRLGDPGEVGQFVGVVLQATGLVAAVISGTIAVSAAYRYRLATR